MITETRSNHKEQYYTSEWGTSGDRSKMLFQHTCYTRQCPESIFRNHGKGGTDVSKAISWKIGKQTIGRLCYKSSPGYGWNSHSKSSTLQYSAFEKTLAQKSHLSEDFGLLTSVQQGHPLMCVLFPFIEFIKWFWAKTFTLSIRDMVYCMELYFVMYLYYYFDFLSIIMRALSSPFTLVCFADAKLGPVSH